MNPYAIYPSLAQYSFAKAGFLLYWCAFQPGSGLLHGTNKRMTHKKTIFAAAFAVVAAVAGCAWAQGEIAPPEPIVDVAPAESPAQATPMIRPAAAGFFADTQTGGDTEALDGEQLLAECISRMPMEPFKMVGSMTMRKRYGVELKKYRFSVYMNWGAAQPIARYDVLTTKDELEETIHAVRHTDGSLLLSRFVGAGQSPAPTPPLNARVMGTDLTWLDVSLDFIWWRNPRVIGQEKVKDRLCDILEVEPPRPIPGCAKARMWIDRGQRVVMQAAQVDEKGDEVRKMWVRAVQKINGRWVLRDIEVETAGSGHRTRLHIDDAFEVKIAETEQFSQTQQDYVAE